MNSKLCQKRPIKIFSKDTCDANEECDDWTDIVVHDITNWKFIIQTPTTNEATVYCDNKKKKTIHVPVTRWKMS